MILTYTRVDKQLVKEEQIKMESMDRLFKFFNVNGTNNREITRFTLLELEINSHTKRIGIVVADLNSTNMFLGYNWLVKYNSEVN